MKNSFFPILDREKNLPFYLTYIGESDRQHPVDRHGYDGSQIIICGEGSGVLRHNGTEETVASPGGFFLPAHSPHAYYPVTEKWHTYYAAFDGAAVKPLLEQLGLVDIAVYSFDISVMKNIFARLFNIVRSDKLYGGFAASAVLYEYIIEFNRRIICAERRFKSESSSLAPVLDYIDLHYSDDITLEALCEIIHVTPQYLCRLFKNRMGLRPLEYVARRRIQQAKLYLAETEKSVKEISADVGYRDGAYFGAVFKRLEGISPNEYRRGS